MKDKLKSAGMKRALNEVPKSMVIISAIKNASMEVRRLRYFRMLFIFFRWAKLNK